MIGPNFLVYISGQGQRDDSKVRAFAEALGLAAYDAKVMLGAPGPRKVAAFVKEEEAERQALDLRQAGFVSFIISKERFSRAPVIFKALKAVEDETGLLFTIERGSEKMDLPQAKGIVKAVIVGFYTQTTMYSDGSRTRFNISTRSKSQIRDPFIHLYSEDPHTILEIRGPKFEFSWLQELGPEMGDKRWLKLAERFTSYYGAKLDTSLFRVPEEVDVITSALNVGSTHGQASAGLATSSASRDDSPVAMAASRIIVYSLVFGA